jgi:exodeoxyribonuclease VII large subunit
VVTSPSGAAVRDFLRVLYRRFHNIQTQVYPVLVQGEKASQEIAEAIGNLNRSDPGLEVIVLTRGGGSIEDLWAFNEERVARAIAASAIPVISAVGHEVDFTIADFVADLRASTPSVAAELLVRAQAEWEEDLEAFRAGLRQALARKLERWEEKTANLRRRLGDPRRRWVETALRLDDTAARLRSALSNNLAHRSGRLAIARERLRGLNPQERLAGHQARLDARLIELRGHMHQRLQDAGLGLERLSQTLQALSPWAVLSRGYALARALPGLTVLTEARQTDLGRPVRIQLARGALDCRVEKVWKEEEEPHGQGEL